MPQLSITNTQSIHSAFTLELVALVYVIFCFILSLIQSHSILFGHIWRCSMHFVLNVLFSSFTSALLFVWNLKWVRLCMYLWVFIYFHVTRTASFVFVIGFVFAVYNTDIRVVVADVNGIYIQKLNLHTPSKLNWTKMQKFNQTKTQIPEKKIMPLQILINSVLNGTIWNVLGWIGSVVICMYLQKIELNHHFEAFHLELNRIVNLPSVELLNLIRFLFEWRHQIRFVRPNMSEMWLKMHSTLLPNQLKITAPAILYSVQCSHGFLLFVYRFVVLYSIVAVFLVVLCSRLNIFLFFTR